MPRILLLATLVACGAPAKPPPEISGVPTGDLPRPSPSRYCPAFDGMDIARPWMSELFPACPTAPFGLTLPVCDGPCPSPCKTTVEVGGMRPGWGGDQTFTHDDRGHFLSSTRDGTPALTCTWTGDHLSTCTDTRNDEPVTARAARDAAGRLTSITAGDTALAITRDPAGSITAIGDTTFTYDAGRLIAFDTTEISYDDAGLPVAEHDAHGHRTFIYDAGRLVRFIIHPERSLGFTYDAQGRLSTLRSGGTMEDDITYTTYAYDCAR